jgi:hypothetical protein
MPCCQSFRVALAAALVWLAACCLSAPGDELPEGMPLPAPGVCGVPSLAPPGIAVRSLARRVWVGNSLGSYLCPPGLDGRCLPPGPREVYVPCAGDLIFFTYRSAFWRTMYALAHTGPPFHVGMVVRLPDGHMAILEAGPGDTYQVFILDLVPRLYGHDGPIWVRRLRVPLTPEQSDCLTQFALDQAGKRLAVVRLVLGITPLRSHGWLHARIFGRACIDRCAWYCSELAVAAAAHAGLIDPHRFRPNTIYPRDLFLDKPNEFLLLWEEPRRWTPCAE